jgi:hypothetical protein
MKRAWSDKFCEIGLVLVIAFFIYMVTILLPNKAKAEEYVYLTGYSKHLIKGDYNESHDLLAYQRDGFTLGSFVNSYDEQSFVFSYSYPTFKHGYLHLNTVIGVTYGYRECYGYNAEADQRVCPYAAPEFVYTKYKLQPAIGFLAHAVAISFRWQL